MVVAAVIVWPWGLDDVRTRWRALGWTNEAQRHEVRAGLRPELATADRAAATALYARALPLLPDRPETYRGLARLRAQAGDTTSALTILAEGIHASRWPVPLLRDRAELLLLQGDGSAALSTLQQLLQQRPDDADALHNLAVLLVRLARPQEALAIARRLAAAAPADPRGWIDQGVILARLGRRTEARAVFREGLRRHPDDPALTANLQRLD